MNIPLKPGHTTTEFWALILTGLSLTGLSAVAMLDAEWVAGSMTLLTILYNASRSQLKKQQAGAEIEALRYELRVSEREALHDLTTQSQVLQSSSASKTVEGTDGKTYQVTPVQATPAP